MADVPIPISDISDPEQIRVKLLSSGKEVHAPMNAFSAAAVHGAPTKAIPVDADEFGYWDSVGLRAVKLTWANLKEGMRSFFYGTNKVTPVDADVFGMLDSATTYSPKYSTWAQIKATIRTYLLGTASTWSAVQTFSAIPVLSGGAIAFPATQIPSAGANDLDDYEKGTFTPGFSATGATFSIAAAVGTYTKIGTAVFYHISLQLNTSGNTLTANNLTVTGLPFTVRAAVGPNVLVHWEQSTTAYISVMGRTAAGTSTLNLLGWTAASTAPNVAVLANGLLHATNGSIVRISGFYFT